MDMLLYIVFFAENIPLAGLANLEKWFYLRSGSMGQTPKLYAKDEIFLLLEKWHRFGLSSSSCLKRHRYQLFIYFFFNVNYIGGLLLDFACDVYLSIYIPINVYPSHKVAGHESFDMANEANMAFYVPLRQM